MWGDERADSGSNVLTEQLESNNVTYVLTDLQPFSTYNVSVTAATDAGNGTNVALIDGVETAEDGETFKH